MQLESNKHVIHGVAIIPVIFHKFNPNQIDHLAVNISSNRSSSNNISNSTNYLHRNHEVVVLEAVAAVMPGGRVAVAVAAARVEAAAAIATAATVAQAATTLMATHGLHRLRAPD